MKQILFAFLLLFITGAKALSDSRIQFELDKDWHFQMEGNDQWYPAQVPGTVHTDLLSSKVIDDPFYRINEKGMQWIGHKNWVYKTNFNVQPEVLKKNNIQLLFKGLDTYAEVYLNGVLIVSADNMFREWQADVKNILKRESNQLIIRFRNVYDENLPKWKSAPLRLMAFPNNDQADTMIAMYSRKAQFHYGWDWGPRLVTCGIWRPVILQAWNDFKINYVQVLQSNISPDKAEITSVIEVTSDKNQDIAIRVKADSLVYNFNSVLIKGDNKVKINFKIDNPKLWWCNGLGEPYLYTFNWQVTGSNAADEKTEQIGIRSLEVVRQKDKYGTSMYVKLNGIPVFMKGANYIPQDNFQNRVNSDRYEYIIKSAADVKMNMLRIWGGGIYEEDIFYNLCDKYGILVWQDMMFACAMYPGDAGFLESVKHEITDNVKRLRNHACLALYCGNNENEAAWYNWGWKEMFTTEQQIKYENDLKHLFYETIPGAIAEADPGRYYHPTSPIAGIKDTPISEGDTHYWGVWHGKEPFSSYEDNVSRFVSEYGFQSYPEQLTIDKFTVPSDRELHSEAMLSHQRCMADDRRDREYGNRLIKTYMDQHYKEPKNFESYLYVSQVLQAEGVKTAVEAHRVNMPVCMGSLYWQIDDCWPVASWSSIDYYGRWKALHYYAKKFFEETHVISLVREDSIQIHIVSDKLSNIKGRLEISCIDFSGGKIYEKFNDVDVKPNSSNLYMALNKKDVTAGNDESRLFLLCRLTNADSVISENILYFREPKDLSLSLIQPELEIIPAAGGFKLKISSSQLIKNLFITSDDESASLSDNFFDLLPGFEKTVYYKTKLNSSQVKNKIKFFSLAESSL